MWYTVVFLDHDGVWHAVETVSDWSLALIAHGAVGRTLTALDYYEDTGPDVLKIVGGELENYATAPALRRAIK